MELIIDFLNNNLALVRFSFRCRTIYPNFVAIHRCMTLTMTSDRNRRADVDIIFAESFFQKHERFLRRVFMYKRIHERYILRAHAVDGDEIAR
jgi:hypothetical protein